MKFMLLFNNTQANLERTQDDPASADYWNSWRKYISEAYASDSTLTSSEHVRGTPTWIASTNGFGESLVTRRKGFRRKAKTLTPSKKSSIGVLSPRLVSE